MMPMKDPLGRWTYSEIMYLFLLEALSILVLTRLQTSEEWGRIQPISEFLWLLKSLANCSATTWYLIVRVSRYLILGCKLIEVTDHATCILPWTHPLPDRHMTSPSTSITCGYPSYHDSEDPYSWHGSTRMATCHLSILIHTRAPVRWTSSHHLEGKSPSTTGPLHIRLPLAHCSPSLLALLLITLSPT